MRPRPAPTGGGGIYAGDVTLVRRRFKRRNGLVLGSRRPTIGCGGRRGRPPLSRALSLRNHRPSHRYPTSEVPWIQKETRWSCGSRLPANDTGGRAPVRVCDCDGLRHSTVMMAAAASSRVNGTLYLTPQQDELVNLRRAACFGDGRSIANGRAPSLDTVRAKHLACRMTDPLVGRCPPDHSVRQPAPAVERVRAMPPA